MMDLVQGKVRKRERERDENIFPFFFSVSDMTRLIIVLAGIAHWAGIFRK